MFDTTIAHEVKLAPTHIRQDRTPSKRGKRCKGKFNPLARGGGIFFMNYKRNQRCIIKVSYTKNSKTRSWAAHGEYLQREHAQEKGEKGLGFNASSYTVDLKTTLRQWQREDDEHVFRMILSPENGHKMDLKQHVKDLIKQMEKDLKSKLEWAAIDHHNTDHPHVHLLIRGRDDKMKTLVIEADYLSRTLRHRSEELATRELGLRQRQDLTQSRERQIDREYVTEIDRGLRRKAVDSIVNYHIPVTNNLAARELRLTEIKRLKVLEKMGLAEKISPKAWALKDDMEVTLKKIQFSNDIIKSKANHHIQTLTHEMPVPTQLQENKSLTGKVVGMGLEDELKDRRYLIMEGIDGKVHYIQASNSIIKARDNYKFHNENVITLETQKFINEQGNPIEYTHVKNHFNLIELQKSHESRLDTDVIQYVKENGRKPLSNFPEKSFAQEYVGAMTKRFDELKKENIFVNNNEQYTLSPNWKKTLDHIIKIRKQEKKIEHTHENKLKLDQTGGLKKSRKPRSR